MVGHTFNPRWISERNTVSKTKRPKMKVSSPVPTWWKQRTDLMTSGKIPKT